MSARSVDLNQQIVDLTRPRPATGPAPEPGRPKRRGLVLGAGGVLGAAWTVGALRALELATGWDPRTAEVVVGTSAGSVLSAFVTLGVSTEQMANHQRGLTVAGEPLVEYDYDRQAPLPPRPKLGRLGSRQLLLQTARHPMRIPPLAALASVLPPGRGSIRAVGDLVDRIRDEATALGLRSAHEPGWPTAPAPWIVTMNYDTGRRVVFGRDGSPEAELADAVTASCSIPGWYEPVSIDGRRYIDGGTCSATSADLLAPLGLDEVVVLAPMASFAYDRPRTAFGRIERSVRRATTKRLFREAAKLRATGTRVTMLGPGPEDLQVIGVNMMDAARRVPVFEMALRTTAAALRGSARFDAGGHIRMPDAAVPPAGTDGTSALGSAAPVAS
ncbi:MAG TPA: patatin-like phospholipase family protein [Frankiaceae bacterium]|nr:patatin-like phospholipase family protein [Frankiaceae bacterium]